MACKRPSKGMKQECAPAPKATKKGAAKKGAAKKAPPTRAAPPRAKAAGTAGREAPRTRVPAAGAPAVGPGAPAPSFRLSDHEGKPVSSADLAGRLRVLFPRPRADAPGCPAETFAFREASAARRAAGTAVFGVSPDRPAGQARFRARHGVTFRLLCDADRALAEAYGVWKTKSTHGKIFLGVERSTLLVDASGVVRRAWRKVKAPGHADEVLAAAPA